MNTITIPQKITKGGDLLIVEKRNFEKIAKENTELKLAMRAVLEGELALRRGETRNFRDFLKVKFPQYAKNR